MMASLSDLPENTSAAHPAPFISNRREDAVNLKDMCLQLLQESTARVGQSAVLGCCAVGTGLTSKQLVLGYTSWLDIQATGTRVYILA